MMAKFPLSCKDGRAEKMMMGFSELEIDVAWQLVQMSRDSYRKDKSQQGEENPICEEDDDDGYPKRRNQRFRSVDHVYKVTQPLLLGGFVYSKKVKLSCS
ncbi:hypothetical protein OIU84_008488 [Salix udensis]|uniref:Uncharacterized protein n=1 Tax=Salix udensis TaxID=889485 RepID=A0AAD6JRB8_9ROSI|nr:hypothetical protein OIU84_008488 [Salix udensis]